MAKTLAQQIKIFSDNINSHIDSSYNNLDRRINEAANIKVPKKTSELENDSSFLTKHQDLSSYAKKEDVYTKDNVDSIATRISNNKQDILVSGVNIKTINGNSLLGSGDLKIKSNSGSTSIVDSSIDLSDYYTKEEVDNKVETSISTTLDNKHYLTEHQKIKTINGQSLVGTGDIMITNSTQPDLSNYVTETALDQKGFITKDNADKIYQSKGNYALKTDIPDMSEYAKKSDIENYNPIDVSSFVTKNDVSSFVTNTELDNKHYLTEHQSLAEYAKKTDLPTDFYSKAAIDTSYNSLNSKIDSKQDIIDTSSFVTNTELDNKHYLTEHQALKTINGHSIVGTGDLIITTESEPDLSGYYTINQVDSLLSKKQDSGNYAKATDIYTKAAIDSSYNSLKKEIDSKQDSVDLSVYAKKTDLPDTTPFLTKTSAAQTYQTIGDYALKSDVAKINLDNYYNKDQIDALSTLTNQRLASKQSTLVSGTNIKTINGNSLLGEGNLKITPDLSNYALKTDIPTDFYSKKYIDTSYNSLNSKIDSKQDKGDYALKTDLPTDFYNKAAIDSSYNILKKEIDSKQDSVDLSVYALKTEIPTDFYSKKYIDTSYNNLDSKIDSKQDSVDLSVYALKTDIPDTSNFVTNTELDNKHYLTEHQDLTSYAKKSDLPTDFYNKAAIDSSYYALQNEINSKQAKGDYALKTDIPDTSNFATKDDLESKQDKVDNAITSSVNGLKIWVGTTVEYNAFDSYDSSTLYFIKS